MRFHMNYIVWSSNMLVDFKKTATSVAKVLGIDSLASNFIELGDEKDLYTSRPSILEYLPWREYSYEDECFLFDDGKSVGSAFLLEPVNVDGFSDDYIYSLRRSLDTALKTLPGKRKNQWVVSVYVKKERVTDVEQWIRQYVSKRAQGSKLTEDYIKRLVKHYEQICDPRGVFNDNGSVWRGCKQQIRMCIWRRADEAELKLDEVTAVQEHHEVVNRFIMQLKDQQVKAKRMTGIDMFEWCFPWFNPAPESTNGDPHEYMALSPYPIKEEQEGTLPLSFDLASMCFETEPEPLNPESGIIKLGGAFSEYLTLKPIMQSPRMGAITREKKIDGGDKNSAVAAIVDAMPPNSTFVMNITILDQDEVTARTNNVISTLKNIDKGASEAAERALQQAREFRELKQDDAQAHRLSMGIYIEGKDEQQLRKRRAKVSQMMLRMDLPIINPRDDIVKQNSFLRNLPMAYNPEYAESEKRAGYTYSHHIANLLPLYGRSKGTGNPGFLFWNRTGEPYALDPFNKKDRRRAAHGVLLGPTGAGKSATTCYVTEHLMAVLKPQIFLIEPAGNSYGLLAEHFKRLGLTVSHKVLSPSSDVAISPFSDALKALEQMESAVDSEYKEELELAIDESDDYLARDDDYVSDDDEKETRDILGEMELSARLMITGGEEKEEAKFTRPDRLIIREAILLAAKHVRDDLKGRDEVIVDDLVYALGKIAQSDDVPRRRERAQYMLESLKLFTQGLDAKFFNRPGKDWDSDADITILDLDVYAREGNADKLAIVMTGLLNRINGIAEKNQHSDRPIIVWIDEAHKATTNPLLASYIATISKMWRKLGTWLWLGTQNLADFPDAARKMLSMAEFWLLLVPPENEIEEISRFKNLTADQEALLREARKAPPNYIEGVVLSEIENALFRNIPPPSSLALALTEKDEKAERAALMSEHSLNDELDAAYMVGDKIYRERDQFRHNQEN